MNFKNIDLSKYTCYHSVIIFPCPTCNYLLAVQYPLCHIMEADGTMHYFNTDSSMLPTPISSDGTDYKHERAAVNCPHCPLKQRLLAQLKK